ncbi:Fis family transcriptional regulator [Mesobacillus campisalis]|uniref:Fis family transcriptional regulator n=1 Tax=Mesobacillus campisalis TaxID=1408103 RepID=A0A0M2SYZ6_9BACI|nr:response regulator [Mesobacillus campisalis]KKK38926.1 Fis family transcriptional regulator [Mesobacillus campisalis]
MTKSLRILLAEDEYLVLMGTKAYVEKLGHQVAGVATDGEKAVELAIEKKPDLVIMDINMPKLDGIDAIKKINETLYIPSIIVSGYHDEKLINRATEEGVLYYLLKPIDIQDLKIAINISLSKFEEFKKLQDELKSTKNALEARKYIEKAKGILMEKMNLKEAEAMKRLQKLSRDKNKKLVVIAKELIEADALFH